jgi:hypothetical protein
MGFDSQSSIQDSSDVNHQQTANRTHDGDTLTPTSVSTDGLSVNNLGCSVYQPNDQSIPNETFTRVEFSVKNFDDRDEFDSSTNYEFTATEAGRYMVVGVVKYRAPPSGTKSISKLMVNASEVATNDFDSNGAGDFSSPVSKLVELQAGDTLYLETYQDSGGTLNLNGLPKNNFLTVHRVG